MFKGISLYLGKKGSDGIASFFLLTLWASFVHLEPDFCGALHKLQ